MSNPFKTGFVGIFGPTNSGKSTLVNALVGSKVSIVSNKVQTTYHSIKGILTTPEHQVVFVDTPGFQSHREKIASLLNQVADKSLSGLDVYLWVFDASLDSCLSNFENLKNRISEHKPNICLLNKVDKVSKPFLLPLIQMFHDSKMFDEVIPISAKKKDGMQSIMNAILSRIPEGAPHFPEEIITDRPTQFLVSEYVREKIYEATRQEIPYATRIEIEKWENDGKLPVIYVKIHVDSNSRKGILIGKKGEMLKDIGTKARKDVEELLGTQVCLKLFVHVDENWKDNSRIVQNYLELGQ